jgi:hypothetical protein
MNDPLEQEAPLPDSPAPVDPFDAALSQYETALSPKTEPEPEPEPESLKDYYAEAARLGFTKDEAKAVMTPELRTRDELSNEREILHGNYHSGLLHLQQLAAQVSQERDRMDVARLVDTLRTELPDLHGMSDETVHALLVGLHETDTRIAEGWRSRYSQPLSWSHQVNRIMTRPHKDLSSRIDEDATATRAAVNFAVQAGSFSGRREPEAPNLNRMSDREFNEHVKREYGFDTKL